MKALLVGCSPALDQVDFSLVDRGTTTVFGVNRVWNRDDETKQWIYPDYLGLRDRDIEAPWIPEVGQIRGVVTHRGSIWCARKDAHALDTRSMRLGGNLWPEPGALYLNVSGTPPLVFQFIVSSGFQDIGIIGIDYTARQMAKALYQGRSTEPSHCFGRHDRALNAPIMGKGEWRSQEDGLAFWTYARRSCERLGVGVYNLCPYAERTPFNRAGIPVMGFGDWCKAGISHDW